MSLSIANVPPSAIEAFGPFSAYHFSRGLVLTIGSESARLKGGPELEKVYDLPLKSASASSNCPPNYWPLIDQIEQEIGVRLVATATGSSPKENLQETSPLRTTFRIGDYCINADYLAEALLAKLQSLESHCHSLALKQVDRNLLSVAEEIVAITNDEIRDGRLGPNELENRIRDLKSSKLPIQEAFFLANSKSLADAVRGTMLRACYHFANMSKHLWDANKQSLSSYCYSEKIPNPYEIVHRSDVADRASNAFASSVIACYSTLDLLYDWFVYLTREPFGTPDFPKKLYFPSQNPAKSFCCGGNFLTSDLGPTDAPHAIPNLPPQSFSDLRNLRNDLIHNMIPDEIRSRICIGIGLPPVNNQLLQYSQYITRDIDVTGSPIYHPWTRGFYELQRDAQHTLHEWLTNTWQCTFDTTEWLTNRVRRM